MTLNPPVIITARLLAGLKIGNGFVSIEYAGETSDHRQRYAYHIDLPDHTEHTGHDLASGVGGGTLQRGLSDLLCFLAAAADSYAYRKGTGRESDNEDLFPAPVVEWAYQNSDEISVLSCELDERSDLIEEDAR